MVVILQSIFILPKRTPSTFAWVLNTFDRGQYLTWLVILFFILFSFRNTSFVHYHKVDFHLLFLCILRRNYIEYMLSTGVSIKAKIANRTFRLHLISCCTEWNFRFQISHNPVFMPFQQRIILIYETYISYKVRKHHIKIIISRNPRFKVDYNTRFIMKMNFTNRQVDDFMFVFICILY